MTHDPMEAFIAGILVGLGVGLFLGQVFGQMKSRNAECSRVQMNARIEHQVLETNTNDDQPGRK